ncbi:hypothetical protein ACBJ59_04735 [Nonomuraea sp. MTCD27]|uniref:hypothetical protein n=1 Tax=Nonomuraea sp. MTCD27 TaxID=1676747 RepID=UPI0035BFAE4C
MLRVGDRRAAQRRGAHLLQAARDRAAGTQDGEDVPADVQDIRQDVLDGLAVLGPAGRDWDDSDLRLWREDGEWSLQGPDGVIEVDGFGFLSTIAARPCAVPRPPRSVGSADAGSN